MSNTKTIEEVDLEVILSDINITLADLETFTQRTNLTTSEFMALRRAIGQLKASRASIIVAMNSLKAVKQ